MLNLFTKNKDEQVEITISNQTVIRVVGVVILSLLGLAALRAASHALTLIFIAFFLAIALNAPVHWLAGHLPRRNKNSRALATAVSFLVVLALIVGFIASIAPPLVSQTNSFINEAPELVEDIRSEDSSLGRFVRDHDLGEQLDKFSGQLSDRLKNLGGEAFSTLSQISTSAFSVLAVTVLTFMMLTEGPRWVSIARRLLPNERQHHAEKLVADMYKVVRGFVNGQVLLAATAALMILVPLLVLDIGYPVALMVIVFVCGLIPMIGHLIGAFIVTLVALFTSPVAAIAILAYYFLYQQIENYVLQPKIQANSTSMSPLLVFSSVLIGVSFSGLLGGLLAIPVAGSLRILLLDYIDRHNLMTPHEAAKKTS